MSLDIKPRSTEIVPLNSDELPFIPEVVRVAIARKKICRIDWRNRDFKDVNALGAVFEDCDFRFSIFERAYFRDARFTSCRFDGARFVDCNFKGATFYKCDLKFVYFQRCLLDTRELVASLPSEPSIRREGLQNLKANAIDVGDHASIGLLVLQEIEATKRHYGYALRGFDTYYRRKYPTFVSKFRAGAQLLWLQLEGLIWGHGEKPWRLFFSCFAILCSLSLVNFWSVMPRVGWNETHAGLDLGKYVLRLFLDMPTDPRFGGFVVIDYVIVLMRFVYIGLFISVLYKSISHR